MSKDAFALISQEPTSGLTNETVIRRKIVLTLAACFLQRFEESDRLLLEAKSASSNQEPALVGDVYLAQGVTAVVRSNYSLAETSFLQALQIARQQRNVFLEASALGNLGIVSTRTQHFGEAIDWYTASLQVSKILGNRTSIAKALGNLGWCYLMMGDSEKALEYLQQAANLSAELGAIKDQQVWSANLGAVYAMNRQYQKAEQNVSEALDIAKKLQNKTLEAMTLTELTHIAVAQGNFDRALEYIAQAEQLNQIASDRTYSLYTVFYKGSIAKGLGNWRDAEKCFKQVIDEAAENVSLRWGAQAELAETYAEEGLDKQAELQFRKALAGFDDARSSLSKEEYRLSFLNTAAEFYHAYIDFLISHGRGIDALAVAEHSRARTLAEGLGIEPAALGSTAASPTEIARRQNAITLAYWLKPEHSYLWAITPSKLEVFTLPADIQIDAAVQAYRRALTGPRDPLESSNDSGQQLYEMLVAPAQKLIPPMSRVIIIADGSLHGLNFETLLAPTPKLHYWIDDATISNANSLAMLGSPRVQPLRNAKPNLLLIGNPVSASTEFPPLAQADEEIRDVGTHFDRDRQTVIDGSKATPAAYLASDPGKFSYIHFVAHGTASRLSPLDSAVVLSPQGDTYKLYARDIVENPLRADLVTVSACYGSGSRSYSGEGLVGLSWAFLRAGAHNVVAALWEANDVSTPKLMDAMYSGISRGDAPATALHNAKLAMLHSDSIYRRPFYWAPFQLYMGSGFNVKQRPQKQVDVAQGGGL